MYRVAKLGAALVYLVAGVLGLFLCIRFALGAGGVPGAVAAGVVFPVSLVILPWAALVVDGAWAPLIVVYGGFFVGGLLHALARAMERGARGPVRER